jgi:CBS domain-containing protein
MRSMTAMTDATTGSFPRSAALSDDLEAPAVALYEHAAALLAVAGALQAAADEPGVGAALSPTLACLEATLEALAGSAERLGLHAVEQISDGDAAGQCQMLRSGDGVGGPVMRSNRAATTTPAGTVSRAGVDRTVEEIMHAGLIGCDADAPVATVAWILADENIHSLVVHLGQVPSGTVVDRWGVITASDLMRALDAGTEGLTARTLAKRSSVTVAPTDRVDRVIRGMAQHDLSHVLVVEDGSPAGIVSALDVARAVGRAATWMRPE